jgi:hypothetical protein
MLAKNRYAPTLDILAINHILMASNGENILSFSSLNFEFVFVERNILIQRYNK